MGTRNFHGGDVKGETGGWRAREGSQVVKLRLAGSLRSKRTSTYCSSLARKDKQKQDIQQQEQPNFHRTSSNTTSKRKTTNGLTSSPPPPSLQSITGKPPSLCARCNTSDRKVFQEPFVLCCLSPEV